MELGNSEAYCKHVNVELLASTSLEVPRLRRYGGIEAMRFEIELQAWIHGRMELWYGRGALQVCRHERLEMWRSGGVMQV